MKYRLAAFDLDGTLAPIGHCIKAENVERLKELERLGMKVVICSGKAEYYLCGLLRQLELDDPIIVAENGAVIRIGQSLPPTKFVVQEYSEDARKSMQLVREKIESALPGLYFQPNTVGITPFPRSEAEFDRIQEILDAHSDLLKDVIIYRHADSFDITPQGINKYTGMEKLSELTGIPAEEMIAVGDGVNDLPMFEYAGLAIGIRLNSGTDIVFESIDEALAHIVQLAQ